MDITIIGYSWLIGICVILVVIEYIVGKLKNENRFKKWWRKHVVGNWNSNHPSVQLFTKKILYLEYVR